MNGTIDSDKPHAGDGLSLRSASFIQDSAKWVMGMLGVILTAICGGTGYIIKTQFQLSTDLNSVRTMMANQQYRIDSQNDRINALYSDASNFKAMFAVNSEQHRVIEEVLIRRDTYARKVR